MPKFQSPALALLAFSFAALALSGVAGVVPVATVLPARADEAREQDQGMSPRDANAPENRDGHAQSLMGANGDTFMEEVVSDKPKPKPKPIPIDLSRVGVSVDPHGNIVPLRDDPNDPWAASGVKPFYNHIESTTTMPYVYQNPYWGASPYRGYPVGRPGFGYGGNPGYGHPAPGYRGAGPGYGSPGFGYGGNPSYGSPGFGYGSYPGYGYPGYGSYAGYGYPGFGYPGYGGYRQGGLIPSLLGAALFGNPTLSGWPSYPPVYPNFGGPFNGYNLGYAPFGVGYVTSGNSATFLSNDPVTGAPLPQGQQGNSQSNFSGSSATFAPGLVPGLGGPWLAPATSYSQNSMWKAFNLAF